MTAKPSEVCTFRASTTRWRASPPRSSSRYGEVLLHLARGVAAHAPRPGVGLLAVVGGLEDVDAAGEGVHGGPGAHEVEAGGVRRGPRSRASSRTSAAPPPTRRASPGWCRPRRRAATSTTAPRPRAVRRVRADLKIAAARETPATSTISAPSPRAARPGPSPDSLAASSRRAARRSASGSARLRPARCGGRGLDAPRPRSCSRGPAARSRRRCGPPGRSAPTGSAAARGRRAGSGNTRPPTPKTSTHSFDHRGMKGAHTTKAPRRRPRAAQATRSRPCRASGVTKKSLRSRGVNREARRA